MGRGAAPKEQPDDLHEPADPEGFAEASEAVQRAKAEDEAGLELERLPPEPVAVDPAYTRALERVSKVLLLGLSVAIGQLDAEVGSALSDGVPDASVTLAELVAEWLQGRYSKAVKLTSVLAAFGSSALQKKADRLHARARAASAPARPPAPESATATRALTVPQAV